MWQMLLDKIKGVLARMLQTGQVESAIGASIAVSRQMQQSIDLWVAMLQGDAPWQDDNTESLGLPAAIAGELARLVLVEFELEVAGENPRARFLAGEYAAFAPRLRPNLEYGLGCGGLAFKPYVDGGRLVVDCVPAWRFYPTAANSRGEITGAVFIEQVQIGKRWYTRLEQHRLTDTGYRVSNSAYRSFSEHELGSPVGLDAVDEWAGLEPEAEIRYKDGRAPERPLFACFRVPFANAIDPASPLGVSVYSRAVGLIAQADKQYSRILWEYEGSELAVDVSQEALRVENGKFATPERRQRLFRGLSLEGSSGSDLYQVFSPTIRDGSLFNGLDKLLKRIEFNCCLAYGTLSDPNNVDKTAEEIRSSKQRSYAAVRELQETLGAALEHLLWVMDLYTSLYGLAPAGEWEVAFQWGDGVLEDVEGEFARRKQLADAGYLKPEKLLAWYLGISEEEALAEYIPAAREPEPSLFGAAGE